MRFLVEIEIRLPGDLEQAHRDDLLRAELDRGEALARSGTIEAIWRVPGQLANRGIWAARDAHELHQAIASLPLWPFMHVDVTALADHPLAGSCHGLPAGLGAQ